jgi:hypothetical protein
LSQKIETVQKALKIGLLFVIRFPVIFISPIRASRPVIGSTGQSEDLRISDSEEWDEAAKWRCVICSM